MLSKAVASEQRLLSNVCPWDWIDQFMSDFTAKLDIVWRFLHRHTTVNTKASQKYTHLETAGNLLTKAFAALFTCSTSGSRPCTHCQNTSRVKSALTTTAGTSQPLWRILLWVRKASPCTGLPASQLALAFKLDAVAVWVVLLYMTGGFKASEGSIGVLASLLRVESGEAFWPGCGVAGPFAGPSGVSACWALIGVPRALSNASCIDMWQTRHLLHVAFHM